MGGGNTEGEASSSSSFSGDDLDTSSDSAGSFFTLDSWDLEDPDQLGIEIEEENASFCASTPANDAGDANTAEDFEGFPDVVRPAQQHSSNENGDRVMHSSGEYPGEHVGGDMGAASSGNEENGRRDQID